MSARRILLAFALAVAVAGGVPAPASAVTLLPTPSLPLPTPTLPPLTPTPTPAPVTGTPTPAPGGGGGSPTPTPVPTAGPSATPVPTACPSHAASTPAPGSLAVDPCADSSLLQQVRRQLGAGLADDLAVEDQLIQSITNSVKLQDQLQARIDANEKKLRALEAAGTDLDQKIAAESQQYAVQREQVQIVARTLYRRPSTLLAYVVRARSLQGALLTIAELVAAGERAHSLQSALRGDLGHLAELRRQSQATHDDLASVHRKLHGDLLQLADLQAQQQGTLLLIEAHISAIHAALAQSGSQAPDLAKIIADRLAAQQLALIALAERQVWTQVLVWMDANGGDASGSAASSGYLTLPIRGAVQTQPFGPSPYPFEPPGFGFAHFHTGVDLAAPEGTTVASAGAGVVALTGDDHIGYGRFVVVAHQNGLVTMYAHLNAIVVSAGQSVAAGQPIGLEGSTGNSTGPHLHFEVRVDGVPVDPLPYIR